MKRKWLWIPVLAFFAGAGAAVVLLPRGPGHSKADAVSLVPKAELRVGCRGRIEPEDGVLNIAAPSFSGRPSVIAELRVKAGDSVQAGQIVAILEERTSLEKTVQRSEAQIEVARKKLAQVQAGVKPSDIDAQKMEVARWESEYEIADADLQRYQKLKENAIATSADLDQKRLVAERNKRTLDAARERLKSLEHIRKEDVDVVAAELASAQAEAEQARAELERTIIRAPASGKILKIHAHPGEEIGPGGILELGKTDRMYVVAEVYETDISRVHPGQKAAVSGEQLNKVVHGSVSEIGSEVTRSELFPTDTVSFADARVIKVKIRVDSPEEVAALIYGKVDVVIEP